MIGGQERFGQYLADTRVVADKASELFATYDFDMMFSVFAGRQPRLMTIFRRAV